ncbi:hypothetical protein CDL15_Pgr002768 [Punica granatum]|uniref:ferroxidase n=1 Tax=Punica granatum TaxID=22663 RepID=A0A218X0R6_PUNGR|nr:hypothetical protein CDL15_Pgr002768 [Punica granatum]
MASKLHLRRWVSRVLQRPPMPSTAPLSPRVLSRGPRLLVFLHESFLDSPSPTNPRSFCSSPLNLDDAQVPTAIDYCSMLQEDQFHKLADSTIHTLQEKFEEYGDNVDIDGFDVDYGNDVLTLKLGDLGTYVLNKQTPNRQIWLSSPVSGPSRFDWDQSSKTWVYRRTKANLFGLLEAELEKLCGHPIDLS